MGPSRKKTEFIQGLTHTNQYAYDSNRITRTIGVSVDTGTYDDQDRLLTYGSIAYVYSRNGVLEQKVYASDTTQYGYDVFGNLKRVRLPNGDSITYIIDGTNRRVGKKRNGAFVKGFIYQNQLKLVAEVDSVGNVASRFIYGSNGIVPDQMIWNDTTYRIISDHLGSPRLVVNTTTGEVAQRMDYDEFGNVNYDSNPGFQPFGFAGGLYDHETNLVRFGARDYSSLSGTWTAKDPTGFKAGPTNLYAYVSNDPVNYLDRDGLAEEKIDGKIFTVHKNDADKIWPSDPHAHIYDENQVVDTQGRIFDKTTKKQVGKVGKKSLGKLVKLLGRYGKLLGCLAIVPGVMEDIERIREAAANGRSYEEQLIEEYKDGGPYIDTPIGPIVNPYQSVGVI
jgi:RHS repeat-associated protein